MNERLATRGLSKKDCISVRELVRRYRDINIEIHKLIEWASVCVYVYVCVCVCERERESERESEREQK